MATVKIAKIVIRIVVWFFLTLCITAVIFLNYYGNINNLKKLVEKNLKDQLTCTVNLGEMDWDLDGLKFGVLTSTISLLDKENNLVLQAGPTRFVWDLRKIIQGHYSHFYSIDSTNLYLNIIRNKKGGLNIVDIFPPGPSPEIDNLKLHSSIIYLVDELNPKSRESLYSDLNIDWEIKPNTKKRKIDLTMRVGSLAEPSLFKLKGRYVERNKFSWQKSDFNFFLVAKKIALEKFYSYFASAIKTPEIRDLQGEFSGVLIVRKKFNQETINIKSRTATRNFLVQLKSGEDIQTLEIPKTDFSLHALVHEKNLELKSFKSKIDELSYELKGKVLNWSSKIPEVDLVFKTNKFNFKNIKPYLPLELLPPSTRMRIEPINDDGFVTIDLMLKGTQNAPKYQGTILLDDFNLTEESGFLSVIKGLSGKLILDNQLLIIDHLIIPIEQMPLTIKGFVDSEKIITSFNISGNNLNVEVLKNLIESNISFPILNSVIPEGKLELNLDVFVDGNKPPNIKGKIGFIDLGAIFLSEDPLVIKKVFGNLTLDGEKVIFDRIGGLINNEPFSILGNLSLKEDENVDLSLEAKHLKILKSLLSFATAKTPFKPIAETVTGEASDLNLKITGKLSRPILDGMVLINNVSFNLPNLADKISNITGGLKFEGTALIVQAITGMIQNTNFEISGLVQDLFSSPRPKLKLVTEEIEISNFWTFVKEQLKTTALDVQVKAIQKLQGYASLDLIINPESILGNINFRDGLFKYESIPFDVEKLQGMIEIKERDITISEFMGSISEKNNFTTNATIYDYLNPDFKFKGNASLNLDPQELVMSLNSDLNNVILSNGIIPTIVNFEGGLPWVNLTFDSKFDKMLQLEFPGYLKKPIDKDYVITGNLDFNSKDLGLILNNLNINAEKLSLSTMGSIRHLDSKEPIIMLFFSTDQPCGLFMILEPIVPLMGFKAWGMIELNGSVSGTTSMYEITTYTMVYELQLPELGGKKLAATDGSANTFFDGKSGILNADINNVMIAELSAKTLALSVNYLAPVININKLLLDSDQGNIFGIGYFDPRDSSFDFNVSGRGIDLPGLASLSIADTSKIAGMTDFFVMIVGKGKTKDEILDYTRGGISFTITDGKVSQIGLLNKVLQFSNIFSHGIFGFNLSNVFTLFFKYENGSFTKIKGDFDLNRGNLKIKDFAYRAKDLLLNAFGLVDLKNSFIDVKFYGYMPVHADKISDGKKKTLTNKVANKVTGAVSIVPDAFGRRGLFIPFLSSNAPRYFKFELQGNSKEQKKIVSHTRRSFKWIKKKNLKQEEKYLPKINE